MMRDRFPRIEVLMIRSGIVFRQISRESQCDCQAAVSFAITSSLTSKLEKTLCTSSSSSRAEMSFMTV